MSWGDALDWVERHTYDPMEFATDVFNGGVVVASKAGDVVNEAQELGGAAVAAAEGVSKVGGAVDNGVDAFVPGGWLTMAICLAAFLLLKAGKATIPVARAAGVEALAGYADTQAPGSGARVRTVGHGKGNSRRTAVTKDVVRAKVRTTQWGGGVQSHVAVPGKATVIERAQDASGRIRGLTLCSPTGPIADARVRRSFTAGFRCTGTVPCTDHPGRTHFSYTQSQQAPRRRKSPKGRP